MEKSPEELRKAGVRQLEKTPMPEQDPEERAGIEAGMKAVEDRISRDMNPYRAARQLDTDEIVAMHELREYLKVIVEMCYQSIGYRRVKNPRIWSMHDIDVLTDFTPVRG